MFRFVYIQFCRIYFIPYLYIYFVVEVDCNFFLYIFYFIIYVDVEFLGNLIVYIFLINIFIVNCTFEIYFIN